MATDLPERLFARDEEPIGDRVQVYQSEKRIRSIIRAITKEEFERVKASPLGQLFNLLEKPKYSGKLGHHLLTKQLQVSKKHELWVLFAGKPIRFSLREFAIVTGLPCGKYPKEDKKKKRKKDVLKQDEYWYQLFGGLKNISVDKVTALLKKKVVTDKEIRFKFACLALVTAILLPPSHAPNICHEHVELIRDIDMFLNYPWGRVAFDQVVSSVKAKGALGVEQKNIGIRAFYQALQFVVVAAVPKLEDATSSETPSSSDHDSDSDLDDRGENQGVLPSMKSNSINPNFAIDMDKKAEVDVESIIPDTGDTELDESELSWSDDEEDPKVTNMLRMIDLKEPFSNDLFVGGHTQADLVVLREKAEKEKEDKAKKTGKGKDKATDAESSGLQPVDAQAIADKVFLKTKDLVVGMRENIVSDVDKLVKDQAETTEKRLLLAIDLHMKKIETAMISSLYEFLMKHAQVEMMPPSPPATNPNTANNDFNPDADAVDVSVNPTEQAKGQTVEAAVLSEGVASDGMDAQVAKQGKKRTHRRTSKKQALQDIQEPSFSLHLSQTETNNDEVPLDVQASIGKVVDDIQKDAAGVDAGLQKDGETDNAEEAPKKRRRKTSKDKKKPSKDTLATQESDSVQQVNKVADVAEGKKSSDGVVETNEDDDGLDVPLETLKKTTTRITRQSKQSKNDIPAKKSVTVETSKEMAESGNAVTEGRSPIAVIGDPNVDYAAKWELLKEKMSKPFTMKIGNTVAVSAKEIAEVATRSKTLTAKHLDFLMEFSRSFFHREKQLLADKKVLFLDTKFVSTFGRQMNKFTKSPDSFEFPQQVTDLLPDESENPRFTDAHYVYAPFCLDKNHWVAVCLSLEEGSIYLLDCNTGYRSLPLIKKTFEPLAEMLPRFISQIASPDTQRTYPKQFGIVRAPAIPQNTNHLDAGLTSVLLMHAHAIGGLEGCKAITPAMLETEGPKIAVLFYEEYCNVLS